MATNTGISADPLDIGELHRWVKDDHAGAVVTFSGITRDSVDGKPVRQLSYDCYKPRAEQTLHAIAEGSLSIFPGTKKVAIYHRVGVVPLGEDSVIIAVSAAHRGEAWKAGEWILEEIKATAEIWKREVFTDGTSEWVDSSVPRREH